MRDLLDNQLCRSAVSRRRLTRSIGRRARSEAGLRAVGVGVAVAGLFAAALMPLPRLSSQSRDGERDLDCLAILVGAECLRPWSPATATPTLPAFDPDGPDFVESLRFFPEANDWVGPQRGD